MSHKRFKGICFLLEGLNAFATTFYFYYLFVFMAAQFGFGNRENLALSAFYGLLYAISAWYGGRIGQRFGYLKTFGVGVGVMTTALVAGAFVHSAAGQVGIMAFWTLGICLTWPNLEALVSDKESPSDLPWMLGIYNVVWAATGALAFFIGGMMLERFGMRSLFWIPAGVHVLQLAVLLGIHARGTEIVESPAQWDPTLRPPALNPRPIARAKTFLKLAWLANPFAYVAINTVVAVIPGVARKFEMTPAAIGVFCSIWFFARLATFVALSFWSGWHYRFRWFISSYLLLMGGFAAILLVPTLWVILIAQVAFGIALGLIYYSSLFYSMDVGETKGEHGGFHEAAIGIGIFAGPAVGAGALAVFPNHPQSGTVAVSALLLAGFAGMLLVYWRGRASFKPAQI